MSNVYLSSTQTSSVAQTVAEAFPLAQTFVIDTPGGAFVTSIDLFFESKDENLPITVQLRSVENGVPSAIVIPFSTVTVPAASVNVSPAAATATKFTFEAPIYLMDNAEYCFEITANSHAYKIWAADIGGYDVTNPSFSITKQPYSGVMFKSQNASAWTPELTKDIKFTLRRANFATSGIVVLNESSIPPVTLDSNPLETYTTKMAVTTMASAGYSAGTSVITATLASSTGLPVGTITDNTGLAVGDRITISGAEGTQEVGLNGSWPITEIPAGTTTFKFEVSNSVALGTYPSSGTSLGLIVKGSKTIRVYHKDHGHVVANSEVVIGGIANGVVVNGIPASYINGTHAVTAVEQDSYTFEISSASYAATTAGRAGGLTVTATENRMFDVLYPNVQQLTFQGANTDWYMRTANGKSLAGDAINLYTVGEYTQIPTNSNVNMTSPKVIRYDPSNPGTKSFYLKGMMSTNNTAISPVIDLNRASVITINNRIDNPASVAASGYNAVQNYQDETTANGSSALSKYITRRIDLNNPAAALRMFVSVNRPSGSNIEVYYKVLTTDNTDANFDSLSWNLVAPLTPLPTSTNPDEYTEIEYDVTETDLGSKFFTAFAVKIVFFSTNSSAIPSCHDFRAIAVT